MQKKAISNLVRLVLEVMLKMSQAADVVRAGASNQPVNFIAFGEE